MSDAHIALPQPSSLLMEVQGERIPPLDGGFNSNVYRVGDHVLKLSRWSGTYSEADAFAFKLSEEHARTQHYLGEEFIPPTKIAPTLTDQKYSESNKVRVGVVQPYIEGEPIREVIQNPDFDTHNLINLFASGLHMYREIGRIPDFAAIEHGFFNPLKSPNIVVAKGDRPFLVDTTEGRTQRSKALGKQWARLIARGTSRAIDNLQFVGP